ncbi:MAG: energy transducer TonB [Prevotella sp.]|nr:energy transducer TonB [Prevotella sp.]
MNKGKSICRTLGTCPACEAEVKYLEQLVSLRRRLGRAAVLFGIAISASLLAAPTYGQQRKTPKNVTPKVNTKRTSTTEMVVSATGGVDQRGIFQEPQAFTIPYRPGYEPEKPKSANFVYDVTEVMPMFPGGDRALKKFLQKEMVYPPDAIKKDIQGRVIITFIVEKNGRITGAKVIKSVDPLLDAEALRIVSKMPRWNPGRQNGKPVRVKYIIPITFYL